MDHYRHMKTGGLYQVIDTSARLQISTRRDIEDQLAEVPITIYRSVDTGRYFARPTSEFMDGRFELVGGPG